MLASALASLRQILSPPFRRVLWRSLGLTVLVLVVVWFALQGLLAAFVTLPYAWLDMTLAVLAGLGLLIGMVFLLGPITAAMAGLFTDEIAAHVEQTAFPDDPPGRELPISRSLVLSAQFALVTVLANLVALVLLFVPLVNVVAFFGANGYLLGRQYFEMAAMRHMGEEEARRLREANRLRVFLGGLVIAALVAVPVVNLLTPLFATAFMTRVFKRMQAPGPDPAQASAKWESI